MEVTETIYSHVSFYADKISLRPESSASVVLVIIVLYCNACASIVVLYADVAMYSLLSLGCNRLDTRQINI